MAVGQRVDGEGEHLLVDQAVAVVHLEGLADEDDRHVGRDDLVAADDDEVDVRHGLRDRMALHLAGQGEVRRPIPVSRDRSWLAPASLLSAIRSSRATTATGTRVGPVPVDDAGDLPFTAQAAHGTRARGAPDFGGEYDFGHNGSPQVARTVVADGHKGLRRTAYQRSRQFGPGYQQAAAKHPVGVDVGVVGGFPHQCADRVVAAQVTPDLLQHEVWGLRAQHGARARAGGS